MITLILFSIMIKELRGRIRFQEELQAKVIDLKRSHNELQEIAYAASHDLREPLRKIQVFSNMLLYQKTGSMDDESKTTLERISSLAGRMQLLITDLLSLTNLTKTDELRSPVQLNRVLHYILIDIDDKVKEKQASVIVQPLPEINGYDTQLKILFKALFDNSLKFTRDGIKPVITISSDTINGHELTDINPDLFRKKFHCITFSDNGIGFDNQFITKIFRIFQRLHTQQSDYEGKGIGLAICQRIMANHEGYIIAHGEPGLGAKFKLFFPVEE
ncbi:MAG: ATP-binding protein [Legionellales bacterium]